MLRDGWACGHVAAFANLSRLATSRIYIQEWCMSQFTLARLAAIPHEQNGIPPSRFQTDSRFKVISIHK